MYDDSSVGGLDDGISVLELDSCCAVRIIDTWYLRKRQTRDVSLHKVDWRRGKEPYKVLVRGFDGNDIRLLSHDAQKGSIKHHLQCVPIWSLCVVVGKVRSGSHDCENVDRQTIRGRVGVRYVPVVRTWSLSCLQAPPTFRATLIYLYSLLVGSPRERFYTCPHIGKEERVS